MKNGIVAYLGHDCELFDDTVRNNILMGDDGDVNYYLKMVCLDKEVALMENGVDTLIGSSGVRLSGGQAQRLAIARALISNAPIILLDEATSALDKNTEEKVLDNIKKLNKKTCIIITHKAAALEVCNREFIINDKQLTAVRKEAIN